MKRFLPFERTTKFPNQVFLYIFRTYRHTESATLASSFINVIMVGYLISPFFSRVHSLAAESAVLYDRHTPSNSYVFQSCDNYPDTRGFFCPGKIYFQDAIAEVGLGLISLHPTWKV